MNLRKLYLELKQEADDAYDAYLESPSHKTWTEAMRTEEDLADFAWINEEEIFGKEEE